MNGHLTPKTLQSCFQGQTPRGHSFILHVMRNGTEIEDRGEDEREDEDGIVWDGRNRNSKNRSIRGTPGGPLNATSTTVQLPFQF